MTVPRDLKSYCVKKILIRVILCVLLLAAFLTVILLWGDLIFNTDREGFKSSCYIGILLLPFIITGVPYKLIDSTWYGTVKRVDVKTTADNASSVKPSLEHLYLKNTVYLLVEKPNGKTIYKKACSGHFRHHGLLDVYREGDTVFHLYGTNNVIILPKPTDTTVRCPVCATPNPIENDTCFSCHRSLVRGRSE